MSAGEIGRPQIAGLTGTAGTYLTFLGLMAFVVLVKAIITLFYPDVFRSGSQAFVFEWTSLAVMTLLGLAGVWLSLRTGFPAAWDERTSNTQRLTFPVLLGLAVGVAYVVFDLITGYSRILVAYYGVPSVNIVFPANVLIYPAGAVILEVLYRLLWIPLFLWLISNLAMGGRWQEQVFWVLALLTSLLEPLSQDLVAFQAGLIGPSMFALVFGRGVLLNLTQAALFRRYGFFSSILFRVAFYMIWHVAYTQ